MNTRYNIRLPADLHRAIKIRAAETGMSISRLVEEWALAGLGRSADGMAAARKRLETARAQLDASEGQEGFDTWAKANAAALLRAAEFLAGLEG